MLVWDYQPSEGLVMSTTVVIPVTCDWHEVHAIIEPRQEGALTINEVVALYCSDCQVEYPAE